MYNDKAIDKLIVWIIGRYCPSDLGIEDSGCNSDSCKDCWQQALSTEPEVDK